MQQYLSLLQDVFINGERRETRNGVTRSVFDRTMRFDLQKEFPLLTTKKVPYRIVAGELLAFLRGYSNIHDFHALGAGNIWAKDARRYQGVTEGDMGRIYGVQWRRWRSHRPILADTESGDGPFPIIGYHEVDQFLVLLAGLMHDPHGRRHVVTAWNPGDEGDMCLPPCHMFFQCYVRRDQYLDMKMYQRSADLFLGVPFNMASYAMLLKILARVCGYEPGRLTMEFGDVHIYEAHQDAVREQLQRRPTDTRPCVLIPSLTKADTCGSALSAIDLLTLDDFHVVGYTPLPAIKAELQ